MVAREVKAIKLKSSWSMDWNFDFYGEVLEISRGHILIDWKYGITTNMVQLLPNDASLRLVVASDGIWFCFASVQQETAEPL